MSEDKNNDNNHRINRDDLERLGKQLSQSRIKGMMDDYASHHLPSDSISQSGTGTGGNGIRPSLVDLEYISQFRIGPAFKVAVATPRQALNAWFDFRELDNEEKIVKRPAIKKWMFKTDFKNVFTTAAVYDSIYGIGTILKRWSGDENKMSEPAPNRPPDKFEALNPRIFQPINPTEGVGMEYNEEEWRFVGGRIKAKTVHSSRVEVLRAMPYANHWRGISSLEPVWLSLLCYMNNLIFITRGIAKWGNMTPVFHHHTNNPTKADRETYLKMIEEFEKNGAYFVGRDDVIDFANTKLGNGIEQTMNVFRLDIASGTELPMNYLFGLSESGGIGSGGALTSERSLMNKYAAIQTNYQDDIMRILYHCNFKDLDTIYPHFRLSLQQTRAQELANQQAEVQLEMQRIQKDMLELQYDMMLKQKEWIEENDEGMSLEEEGENIEEATDFTDNDYKRKLDSRKEKMNELMGRLRYIRVQDLEAGIGGGT